MTSQIASGKTQNKDRPSRTKADKTLTASIISWFAVALLGQWLFAVYITIRYGIPVIGGNYDAVNTGGMITGFIEGDMPDNLIYFGHILPVIWLSIGGVLQFVPQIRRRFPLFHRLNGRVILTLGILGAISALYLTWVRGSRLSDLAAIGITVNGLMIPVAAVIAWRYARDIQRHMRWAVHSYLLINGVWTFRLYLFGWYMLNQGANGNTQTLDGPVDLLFSFACYALPMMVAELVFWAQRQDDNYAKWVVTSIVFVGCFVTAGGLFAVLVASWLPALY